MNQWSILLQGKVMIKKRRPSIAKTQATKHRIILAGLQQFNLHGFSASKIADIALAAEVGKGTIYSYFETKTALLEGVIDYLIQETYHPIQHHEISADISVKAFILQEMLPALATLESAGRADIARLILKEGGNFKDIRELYYNKVYLPSLLEVTKLIELAIQRGELKAQIHAEQQALLVMAPIWLGMVNNGILAPEQPVDLQALFQAQMDALFA